MSKNKSQLLARQAGGHLVYGPRSGTTESIDLLRARINFIFSASGKAESDAEVINRFLQILSTFENDPAVLDDVSKRMGLPKRDALKELQTFQKLYGTDIDLHRLFMNKKW